MLAGVTNVCHRRSLPTCFDYQSKLDRLTDGGGASVQMHAISTTCTTVSFFQKEQHDEPGGLHAPLNMLVLEVDVLMPGVLAC
jgi:hypothetical protein